MTGGAGPRGREAVRTRAASRPSPLAGAVGSGPQKAPFTVALTCVNQDVCPRVWRGTPGSRRWGVRERAARASGTGEGGAAEGAGRVSRERRRLAWRGRHSRPDAHAAGFPRAGALVRLQDLDGKPGL